MYITEIPNATLWIVSYTTMQPTQYFTQHHVQGGSFHLRRFNIVDPMGYVSNVSYIQ